MNRRSKYYLTVICGAVGVIAGIVAWRTSRWVHAARQQRNCKYDFNLLDANRRFYNELWSEARLVKPERFNTWPMIRELLPYYPVRLEVGPGLRPRLPIVGTNFIDASAAAVKVLQMYRGRAMEGIVSALPFANSYFDFVCALDVVEHTEDGEAALAELARVMKPGGILLLSVPLHQARWSHFDEFVGHGRRYNPGELLEILTRHGFQVERSTVYGMQPRSTWLSDFGMRCLLQKRKRAMWYYTHLLMPIGLLFQPRLRFVTGMVSGSRIDEVLLVCRRGFTGTNDF